MENLIEKYLSDTTSAEICPPATDNEIANCSIDLHKGGYPKLPDDYIVFLKETDGFGWNGKTLYGSEKQNYIYSLLQGNRLLSHKHGINGRLVIGSMDEEVILYDWGTNKYQLADRMDLMVYDEFSDFEDLFAYITM